MSGPEEQNECSLLPLAHPLTPSLFPDPKTRQLYDAFPNSHAEQPDEAQLHYAESITTLPSHFSTSKYKSFRKEVDTNLVPRGATLRQNLNPTNFNRNRTYSIVKTSCQRKRAITATDLEHLPKDSGKPSQIVYSYADAEDHHGFSKVVQSRYLPLDKQCSLKSSRNDLRSLMSTRYHPNLEPTKNSVDDRQKAKSYKFAKMEKKGSTHQQERVNCNIFNFMDTIFSKQDPALKGLKDCPPSRIEPIARPIKLKLWK